ncbi:hypothetical protein TI04_13715, partial [Achromatium sp. WMS2]
MLCAIMTMHATFVSDRHKSIFYAILTSILLGYSMLVRPGNQAGVALAIMLSLLLSVLTWRLRNVLLGMVVTVGAILVVVPYYYNCTQKYDSVCLISPKVFDPGGSVYMAAQSGLRGARVLWSKTGLMPGAPVLIDDFMDKNFYQRCQIQSLFGVDEKSFVGCLLTRPLHTPVLLTKKW